MQHILLAKASHRAVHSQEVGKKPRLLSHIKKSMGMEGVDSWGILPSVYQEMGS